MTRIPPPVWTLVARGGVALSLALLLGACGLFGRPQPGFTLSLNPTSLTVEQGSSGTVQLTLTPQNGFTGTVNLSLVAGQDQVPAGLTLSPGSVQVSGSSPVNRDLTLSAQTDTTAGTYRLKVRATSGSLTREAGLTVTVSAPGDGGGGGGGDSTSGTVNTPGGQVRVSLQGGTFTQGPTAQNVSPPQGFQAPYGGIAFTAQVPQGGTLTVTLTFPNPIPQGAQLQKYLNNTWQAIPGAQLSGNTATFQVQDGGPLDADGQANGQVVDPVALLASGSGGGSTTQPDFTWKIKSFSDPSSRYWKAFFVDGRYLFVSHSAAYYSPDGQEWKEAYSFNSSDRARVHVAHNGTVVVVVFDDNVQRYYFSGDGGLSWETLPAPDGLAPRSVAYGAGAFVMLASEPPWSNTSNWYLYRSTDGRTWVRVYTINSNYAGPCRYVVFGDRFVVGCSTFLVSGEGIGWQEVRSDWFETELDDVVAVGDTYVGGLDGYVIWFKFLTDPSGTLRVDSGYMSVYRILRLSSSGSEAFLAAEYRDGSRKLLRSTDGQNWQVACSANCPMAVVKGGTYIGFGDLHTGVVQVWTSMDGSTWTPVVLGGLVGTYLPFFQENGVVYRWTNGGFLLSRDGGETWVYQAVDLTGYYAFGPYGRLIKGGGRYVSVGNQSIAYSSDLFTGWAFGKDQNGNPLRLTEHMQGIAYSAEQGRFVAVGSRGSIYVSNDGEHWQRVYQVPGENNLRGVVFAHGKFVAVGWGSPTTPSGVFVSEDGLTWRVATDAPPLEAVVYAQSIFVGVGPGGVIAVSQDGESWQIVQRVFTNPIEYRTLKAVCYNATRGYFVAAGNDGGAGEVWVSVDGRNWFSVKRALSSDVTSVLCLSDGHILVGGSDLGGRGITVEKGYINQ